MAILDTLKHAVSEFIARTKSGPFVPEVEEIRNGPEAKAARAKRETATTVWGVVDDEECGLADRTGTVVAQQLTAARTLLARLEPLVGGISSDPALPAARQLVLDLEKAAAPAAAWSAAAGAATRGWVFQKRRKALQAADAEYAEVLAHAAVLAVERQTYAEETTRLAGQRDPDDPGHPLPLLLTHAEAIQKAAAWWAPKPTPVASPPRPGLTRVTAMKPFHDPDGGLGILRRPGDVFDIRTEYVRELLANELAVEA